MKVQDVMMRTPVYCRPETNLGSAIEMLWVRNCGMLPIVDARQKVIGVVTDRDLCVALGTRNRPAGQITVGEVATGEAYTCRSGDDIHVALQAMANNRVRRLPVVNEDGVLEGILSMDNVVLHTETGSWGRQAELSDEDVVKTLREIYGPRLPQVVHMRAAVN
ncbi:MAG TPA: CBS domain-containing protein [Candidatus Acidoferrales bacterium]|nr:CBS domain-containing protein [Candidatus Acidoferrales bacterium]